MCVGLPGQVRETRGTMALVDRFGRTAWCSTLVRPDVAVGDWVLVHAGLIVDRISADEAASVFAALRSVEDELKGEQVGPA
jgi:hydrogenase expression/formation protein HypC